MNAAAWTKLLPATSWLLHRVARQRHRPEASTSKFGPRLEAAVVAVRWKSLFQIDHVGPLFGSGHRAGHSVFAALSCRADTPRRPGNRGGRDCSGRQVRPPHGDVTP